MINMDQPIFNPPSSDEIKNVEGDNNKAVQGDNNNSVLGDNNFTKVNNVYINEVYYEKNINYHRQERASCRTSSTLIKSIKEIFNELILKLKQLEFFDELSQNNPLGSDQHRTDTYKTRGKAISVNYIENQEIDEFTITITLEWDSERNSYWRGCPRLTDPEKRRDYGKYTFRVKFDESNFILRDSYSKWITFDKDASFKKALDATHHSPKYALISFEKEINKLI